MLQGYTREGGQHILVYYIILYIIPSYMMPLHEEQLRRGTSLKTYA